MIETVTKLACHMPELLECQHFEIDITLWDFALEQGMSFFPNDEDQAIDMDELVCPSSTRLPAPKMTIYVHGVIFFLMISDQTAGVIVAGWKKPEDESFQLLGGIEPGKCPTVTEMHDKEVGVDGCFNTLFVLAHVLSLINEPRILVKTPGGSRQQRRAANRGMGFAVDAWTRVTWDLSKETVAKVSRDPGYHKVPLHWRRGHYRRALAHYQRAVRRPDAFRVGDRNLWWQWIEGQWVGHPAFGIKRSIHAPRLSGADIAKRSVK